MAKFPRKALGAGFLKGMFSKCFGEFEYTERDIQSVRSSAYYSNFRVENAETKFTVKWVQALRIPDGTYKIEVHGIDVELHPAQSMGLTQGNAEAWRNTPAVCDRHELVEIMDEMIRPLKEEAEYMTVDIPACIPMHEDCNKELHISIARELEKGPMRASDIRKKSEELETLARCGGYQTSRKDLEKYYPA